MIEFAFLPVAGAYLLVVGLLFAIGVNFYYLTFLSMRKKVPPRPPAPPVWPAVTVQLPVYNEMYVVERLVEAAARLDYPRDLLEIQVLDDSTDETAELARRAVERGRRGGLNITHLHRRERTGFKAGALAAGTAQARGEFLAIFDADFVPNPDFLTQTIPYFQDPRVAFLQTRWGHLNRNYSLLTFLQSLIIDAHFVIEQFARSQAGFWFNFNGTAGVWRRAAVIDAGGWQADTLTEDLDLSYRALLRGWQAVYLRDVEVPAELPVAITAYRRQQYRWARGSLEVAQRQLPAVFRAPVPRLKKLEALFHLTGYGVHLLLFAIACLYPFVLAISRQLPDLHGLFTYALLFNFTAFAQTFFFISAQHQLGRRWWAMLPAIFFVSALGAGMMINTVKAALQIAWKQRTPFERTPKFGIRHNRQRWNGKRYQLGLDRVVFFELAFAVYNGWTALAAITAGNWVIAFYALLFCAGLLFTAGMSIQQALGVWRQRRRGFAQAGADSETDRDSIPAGSARSPSPAHGRSRPMPGDRVIHKDHDDVPAEASSASAEPAPGMPSPAHGRSRPMPGDRNNLRDQVTPGDPKIDQGTPGDSRHASLHHAILKTIAYADVFDTPLTALETHRYLKDVRAALETVQAALAELCEQRRLCRVGEVYLLPGRETIAETRRRRQAVAARLWPQAEAWGRRIARLPFVRMVAVTGALAVDNVEEGADIDYLIVTQAGRLWLCRGLVVALVRMAGLAGVTLCPNYLLSERSLVFTDRSVYTAHELVQVRPLFGREVYARLRQLNIWTEQYLPNASDQPARGERLAQGELLTQDEPLDLGKPFSPSKWLSNGEPLSPGELGGIEKRLQRWTEGLLRTPPGTWLEDWEMQRKIRKFQRSGQAAPETGFCADWCKGHFHSHGQKTLDSYTRRLQAIPVGTLDPDERRL